jgi:hypothetical protein
MEDIDLEEPLRGNSSRIWPQNRHIADQRIQTFRFAMGFLGIFSGALTWLLFQDTGPWIYTPLALVMTILSVALAGMESQFAAHLRHARALLRSEEVRAAGKGPSENGGGASARFASGGEPSFRRDAWPIYGAYAAFAILGLFFGALPIWARPLLAKARVQENANGKTNPDQRLSTSPYGRPANLPPGAPASFGNPRQFPGVTPIQVAPFVRPPVRTPPVRQGPFGSPPAAVTTPPSGAFPPNSSPAKPSPGSAPTTPQPNAGAPK